MLLKDILKDKRIQKGMTMFDVAKAVGVSEATVSRWESGNIANMKRDNVAKLSITLDIPIKVLMGWDEKEPADNADELDREIDRIYASLPDDKKQQAIDFLRFLQGK